MKQIVKKYPDELKQKVVSEYLTSSLSQSELMSKYGIKGKNNISNWIRKFDLKKPSSDDIKLYEQMSKESKKSKLEKELESKIKKLEQQLSFEKLKSKAYNTLIDVAEEELKIDIRKKSGSKQ